MAFICGSLHNQEEDDFEVLLGSRKSRRINHSFCSRNCKDSNKNPFSDRGLDKFSALLAELDDKRQKILTQKGSEDISLVRFAYSNSNNCRPIVVKVKDHRNKPEKTPLDSPKRTSHGQMEAASPDHEKIEQAPKVEKKLNQKSFKKNSSFNMKLEDFRRPSYYLPLFTILILIFLVFFGRSFAILCTSIGWYLVPTINGSLESSKKPKKMKKELVYGRKFSEKNIPSPRVVVKEIKTTKKDDVRKPSEKKISSPRSVLSSPMNDGHRRSFQSLS